MIGKCPKCDATPNIIVEALERGTKVRSEHCPSCNFCVTIAKPSSALHSILNGRPKWLRASCVRWGKDLLPATEFWSCDVGCLATRGDVEDGSSTDYIKVACGRGSNHEATVAA